MYVKFDKPTGKHGNTGSSSQFCNYLEKENKGKELDEQEKWFGHTKDDLNKNDVRFSIDKDHQGIGKKEGKFTTGSINITEDEYKSLGKTDQEREQNFKQYAKEDFTKELAENFTKKDRAGNKIDIEKENVNIYYKLERNRQYKGTDEEVKKGEKEQGQDKDEFNTHIHFIVARKTQDGQNRISPTTKNRKEFDRNQFLSKAEQSFDKKTGYERDLKDTFEYKNTMKNGTFKEKNEMLDKKIEQELKEQLNQTKEQKQEKEQTQEIKQEQKQSLNLGRNL